MPHPEPAPGPGRPRANARLIHACVVSVPSACYSTPRAVRIIAVRAVASARTVSVISVTETPVVRSTRSGQSERTARRTASNPWCGRQRLVPARRPQRTTADVSDQWRAQPFRMPEQLGGVRALDAQPAPVDRVVAAGQLDRAVIPARQTDPALQRAVRAVRGDRSSGHPIQPGRALLPNRCGVVTSDSPSSFVLSRLVVTMRGMGHSNVIVDGIGVRSD